MFTTRSWELSWKTRGRGREEDEEEDEEGNQSHHLMSWPITYKGLTLHTPTAVRARRLPLMYIYLHVSVTHTPGFEPRTIVTVAAVVRSSICCVCECVCVCLESGSGVHRGREGALPMYDTREGWWNQQRADG